MSENKFKDNPVFAGDVVLQEIWRIKDDLSAARGHDIHRLFADLRKADAQSRRKRIKRATAATAA